jgi:hypothetical protein
MSYPSTILLSAALLSAAACKSPEPQPARSERPNRTVTATTFPSTNAPAARPVNVVTGRIVGVREPLRFVIVDFTNSRLPQLDQQLNVYRLDQKVAVLKVSGPFRGTMVAADVTAGEVIEGDLVRDR